MNIEIGLLRALSTKQNLLHYGHMIESKTLSVESLTILRDYQVYFVEYSADEKVRFEIFRTFFFSTRHPYLDEKSIDFYKEIFRLIDEFTDETDIKQLLKGFEQQQFYDELKQLLQKNVDSSTIRSKIDAFEEKLGRFDIETVLDQPMDLKEALVATDRTNGLIWRCQALKDHFQGGLIKGDFIITAAITDGGKTSWCASETSYMAQQLKEDQYILWFNTEGAWERILPRLYCAALNTTHTMLTKHFDTAIIKYKELMKGNENRIKVINAQGMTTKDIERCVKKFPPALIIFDMLDHITGFEKYMNGSDGVTGKYKQLYQWGRQLATDYCPIIAMSQLNRVDYEKNNVYPLLTNLEDSGIAKQSAATAIIMIGCRQGDDTTRYLSTPKFKNGARKSWRAEVRFDPDRSRFI